jgi:hypothetical protein
MPSHNIVIVNGKVVCNDYAAQKLNSFDALANSLLEEADDVLDEHHRVKDSIGESIIRNKQRLDNKFVKAYS